VMAQRPSAYGALGDVIAGSTPHVVSIVDSKTLATRQRTRKVTSCRVKSALVTLSGQL